MRGTGIQARLEANALVAHRCEVCQKPCKRRFCSGGHARKGRQFVKHPAGVYLFLTENQSLIGIPPFSKADLDAVTVYDSGRDGIDKLPENLRHYVQT